jgi:hypothetical protein
MNSDKLAGKTPILEQSLDFNQQTRQFRDQADDALMIFIR